MADISALPPLVGVGAFPYWSGDAALGPGVATGVDEACALNTLVGISRDGGSREKSVVVLTCNIINSNGIGFDLLCCSARFVQATELSVTQEEPQKQWNAYCQARPDPQVQYSR